MCFRVGKVYCLNTRSEDKERQRAKASILKYVKTHGMLKLALKLTKHYSCGAIPRWSTFSIGP